MASMGQEFENGLYVACVIEKQQCASSSALDSHEVAVRCQLV